MALAQASVSVSVSVSVQPTVMQGVSSATVELEIGRGAQKSTDEVRAVIDRIRGSLPLDLEALTVQRCDIDSQPWVNPAVSTDTMSDLALS